MVVKLPGVEIGVKASAYSNLGVSSMLSVRIVDANSTKLEWLLKLNLGGARLERSGQKSGPGDARGEMVCTSSSPSSSDSR